MKKIENMETIARSEDVVATNVEHLKRIFPEAFIEGKIDFETLKQLLGGVVEEREEKFGLTWHGKRQARQLALTPSMGTLRPCPEESVDWDTTKNLMIEGDNLEVLKLLQKSYSGKVKLIYIDPPYNTGKDFVYRDDFHDSIKNYMENTQQLHEGQRITSNSEANGRFHTDWMNMMYPRLRLARNLLREDGVMFISIDDSEFANLKCLCVEIFGDENFIATLIWEKGRKNDAALVSIGHEYMLVFAKRKDYFQEKKIKWRESKPGAKEILAEYLRLRKIFSTDNSAVESGIRSFYDQLPKTHPSKKHSRYNKVDDKGVWRDDNMSWPGGGGPTYAVIHPETHCACAVPDGGWRYSTLEKMNEMIRLGKVVFRKDHTEPPIRKTYLVESEDVEEEGVRDSDLEESEADDLPIQVAGTYFYRSGIQASNELSHLFGKKVFNNPKDREVISRWISYVGASGDDIVMDFFAGSGTTAHSVLELNVSEEKALQYILVQLPEAINPRTKGAKPAVDFLERINRPCLVSELTKERLRRTSTAIRNENPTFRGDLGFRVFKLDSSNISEWEHNGTSIKDSIQGYCEPIKPDRTESDILYELLLKLGIDLCIPIEKKRFASKTVYSVAAGVLIACLEKAITRSEVDDLARGIVEWHKELAPATETTCVFLDSAFADDVAKTNLAAILNQHGLTNVRSL